MFHRIAVAAAAVVLLAGCATTPVAQPVAAPSPTVSATPDAPVPDIPTQSTEIQPVRAAVPPVRVEVSAAGVAVSVEPVGILKDGTMELPADPAIAGWYEYGSDPASATGTTVVAAHVDSLKYGLGPFSKLKNVPAGTPITVTTADGATHQYTVESVQSILKAELPIDQVFDRDGAPRLALITCGGQFDYGTGHYSDNILLTAVPVA